MTQMDITTQNRSDISDSLNKLVATQSVLAQKAKNFHWNVVGMQFHDLHSFFEEMYSQIYEKVDDIAERVRSLGMRPLSSFKEFIDHSIVEENNNTLTAKEMIKELLDNHEEVIRYLREEIPTIGERRDFGTEDFLTGILEEYEKRAWMLRSFLE